MKKWVAIHLTKEGNKMKNDLVQKTQQEVVLSEGQKLQAQLLQELEATSEQLGKDFTDYGKTCLINAIASLVILCRTNNINIKDLEPTLLKLALQNIGYTELNCAALPSEAYIDLRKTTREVTNEKGETKKVTSYNVMIKPQGAGNEKLVRKYGVGLVKDTGLRSAWLIREGDEFTLPQFDGINTVPPTYKPKLENMNKKVIAVVYPAIKTDGSVEYLMATRESIIPNVVAQIRQNTRNNFYKKNEQGYYLKDKYGNLVEDTEAKEKFYNELNEFAENHTLDELLANKQYWDCVNPTYTSGGSKEAMILRKMKNNALKNYPKEYDNSFVAQSVKNMFEDQDDTLDEKPFANKQKDVVESVEQQINKPQQGKPVASFEVNEDGEVTRIEDKPEPKAEEPKPQEVQEQPTQEQVDDDRQEEQPQESKVEEAKEPSYEDMI